MAAVDYKAGWTEEQHAQHREHQAREKHRKAYEARQVRRLKALAETAGYKGMQGGWIYKVWIKLGAVYNPETDAYEPGPVRECKPVAQGWAHFEHLYGAAVGFVREPYTYPKKET